MAEKQLDVLAVGDVVTDAFIKLLDKEEKVEHEKDGSTWLAIPFGTKIPFDHVEVIEGVGNALMRLWLLRGSGLNSGLGRKYRRTMTGGVTLYAAFTAIKWIRVLCTLTLAKKAITITCFGIKTSAQF
jgi:hypothetical protein